LAAISARQSASCLKNEKKRNKNGLEATSECRLYYSTYQIDSAHQRDLLLKHHFMDPSVTAGLERDARIALITSIVVF
jgi:hypothetical protein